MTRSSNNFGDWEEPHAVARSTDPWTSWEAARGIRDIREDQWRVLWVLRNEGAMTHEEIQEQVERHWRCKTAPSGIRTRCKELVRGEKMPCPLARNSGKLGVTSSGNRTIMWEAIPESELHLHVNEHPEGPESESENPETLF